MNVVLIEPEIPPNTGNVARLCAATNTVLHLIGPLGFRLDDKQLKRAGMDYWQHVRHTVWSDWTSFHRQLAPQARLWFIEAGGKQNYASASFRGDDYLVFGRETAGLPKALLEARPDRWLRIPMFHSRARSLNLSNCVAVVLYEALRQAGFPNEFQSAPP